jgi:hypothetical protein
MTTNAQVRMMMTFDQTKELTAALIRALPELTFNQAAYWTANCGELDQKIASLMRREGDANWSAVTDGPDQPTTSALLAQVKKLMPVDCYLTDEQLDSLFPVPVASTTRVFLPNQEADEEQKNKSYQDLEAAGLLPSVITLRERIILEIQYFRATGKHLDVKKTTLTSSRDSDGRVVSVDCLGGKLLIIWYGVDSCRGYLRARVAVS